MGSTVVRKVISPCSRNFSKKDGREIKESLILISRSRKMAPLRFRSKMSILMTPLIVASMLLLGGTMTNAAEPQPTSFIPEEMMAPLASSFNKLIPQFNPTALTIQFKTDSRISLSPTSPSFVPFLLQYQTLAMNEIGQSKTDDASFRNGMETYFNSEYGKFISEIGLPVGCVSFYAGATELAAIQQLESLSKTLNVGDGSNRNNAQLFAGIGVYDLVHRLNLDRITGSFNEGFGSKAHTDACGKIFWTLKDGTVVANLPSTDFSARQVWIPTKAVGVNIYSVNVTHELAQYFGTGVSCINGDDIITKRNFSSTVTKWMSSKLIPQILSSPKCIPGFPRILQLLISIEMYKHTLVYVQPRQRVQVVRHLPPKPRPVPPPPLPPPPLSPVYEDDDYYRPYRGEPYVGPLQPIRTAYVEDDPGPAQAGFSSTLLTVLIVFFIIFAFCCCCCCLIPLCCPDLKTCARMQKILVRAKRSFERIKNKKSAPEYTPIFDDEDRDEEDYEPEEKPSRKKRPVRHQSRKKRVLGRKCRPKIEIPICSDTSINICVTTEEDNDGCVSSTDNQQIGYISKELDTAFYQEDSEDGDTSPMEVVKKRKPPKRIKKKQRVDKSYATRKHETSNTSTENDDVNDRYQDAARGPKKLHVEKSYAMRKHETHNTSTENDDVKDRYQDAARGPSLQKQRSYDKKRKPDDIKNWIPPNIQNIKTDEVAAQMKSKLYDKLATEWKYKFKGESPKQRDDKGEDLGDPPPPRTHKGDPKSSLPF